MDAIQLGLPEGEDAGDMPVEAGAETSDETEMLRTALHETRERYLAVLRAQPDVVPELISGDTLAEIDESHARSKEAFARLKTRLVNPAVAAGGGARSGALHPGKATAWEKISWGIANSVR